MKNNQKRNNILNPKKGNPHKRGQSIIPVLMKKNQSTTQKREKIMVKEKMRVMKKLWIRIYKISWNKLRRI